MAEAAIVFISISVLIRVLWLVDRATKSGKPIDWGILGYRRFFKPKREQSR